MATTIKDRTAIAGIGETAYYKRGCSPDAEFKMALQAVMHAAEDAGLPVRAIDGFSSFCTDRNEGTRLASALGLEDLKYSCTVGLSGHAAAAVANAAAAVSAGYADYVVAFRSVRQGPSGRLGQFGGYMGASESEFPMSYTVPHGILSPAVRYAMRTRRFMEDWKVSQDALCAIAMASYFHAQKNPRAVMYGKPLTAEKYHESRWIVEPFHLYDICMENDCAAAVIVTTAERAKDLRQAPAYIMSVATGSDYRQYATSEGGLEYATVNMRNVARRLFATAGVGPDDVQVAQIYDNFTGAVILSLVEHGFCAPEEANDFLTFDNLIAPNGRLPINTSGGNVAEAYVQGLQLVLEAVRQVRGTSTCQVPDVEIALATAAPFAWATGSMLLRRD